MTDIQQHIFDYITEEYVCQLLPPKYFWHYTRVLDQREDALLETLTDQQRDLFEAYQMAQFDRDNLERQALFRATWAMAHELLCP